MWHVLGPHDPTAQAVDADIETIGDEAVDRLAVAVDDGYVDGDEVDARSKTGCCERGNANTHAATIATPSDEALHVRHPGGHHQSWLLRITIISTTSASNTSSAIFHGLFG